MSPDRFRTIGSLVVVAAVCAPGGRVTAGPGDVLWRFEIPSNFPGAYVATGADGTVYFTDNLRLRALTPDGSVIWASPVGTGGGQPVVIGPDGTIYTGHSFVSALDPADGSLRWQFSTGSVQALLAGPGVGSDGNIFAVQGTINDGVGFFSIDPDGELRWTELGSPMPQGFGSDNAPIVFGTDRFFTGFSDNAGSFAGVWAFELDGNQLWQSGFLDLSIPASSSPILAPGGDLIVGWGQSGVASVSQDGEVNWVTFHPDGVSSLVTPAVGPDGAVYSGDWLGVQLWSLNPDGTTRWTLPNTSDTLGTLGVSPDNRTIVATGGPWIRGYDPADGGLLWQLDLLPEEGLPQDVRSRRPFFSADGSTSYVITGFVGGGVGHSYLYAIDLGAGDVPTGDIDGDGVVGILDFLALLAAWGPCPDPPADCPADLDGDGSVGILDFLLLLANWTT